MIQTHTQARREADSYVIYCPPTKEVEQYMAHKMFYREFGVLYLFW